MERSPEIVNEKMRNWRRKHHEDVVAAYGGACTCCGEKQIKFLTIDHVFDDGAKERRAISGKRTGSMVGGAAFYARLRRLGYPKDRYRLLCFNCNCGRARNGGRCPHESV